MNLVSIQRPLGRILYLTLHVSKSKKAKAITT